MQRDRGFASTACRCMKRSGTRLPPCPCHSGSKTYRLIPSLTQMHAIRSQNLTFAGNGNTLLGPANVLGPPSPHPSAVPLSSIQAPFCTGRLALANLF